MGKKYKRLFEQITTRENFDLAYQKTRKGKRRSFSYLEFKEYGALNLEALRQEVADGDYSIGGYRQFFVYEPKMRLISALPFRDRIVQHAINNIIEPIFDRSFLPYTFACRPGMGAHKGVVHVQSQLRKGRATHCLKTDFSKYFPSIHRPTLYKLVDAKVSCARTGDLLRRIVPDQGTGLHIGSLSSQLWANTYGALADRFVHEHLRPMAWARYMDDIILLDNDSGKLRAMKEQLESFSSERMRLQFSKWSVQSIGRGINFLGYRIWPRHKLVRKASVCRAKKKLARMREHNDTESADRFLAAWRGHISWADSHNLQKSMEINNAIRQ